MPETPLEARSLVVSYGPRQVIAKLDLQIAPQRVTALIGPNGSGKSTLLKAFAHHLPIAEGQVLLDGRAIHEYHRKDIAKRLSLLPQSPLTPEGLRVEDLVAFGRFAHQNWLARRKPQDQEAIDAALEMTAMQSLRKAFVDELSGGQRQRAWIAMAVAQQAPVMLLDEPTTYLDIAHQFDVLALLRRLNRQHGRTIVMVLHDINHAARYCDHIVAMKEGTIAIQGTPQQVVTPQWIETVFGVKANVFTDPASGRPWFLPVDEEGCAP